MIMKTTIETISPKYAAYLLEQNIGNRQIGQHRVRMYARDMQAGNWQLTHQGILLGKDGIVIDGQHRLHAVLLSGCSVPMMVCVDENIESARNCMVDLQMPRSAAFIIGKSTNLVGVANLAIELSEGNGKTSNASIYEKERSINIVDPYFHQLMNGSKSTAKNITVAPVMLGAIINIAKSKSDYAIEQFNYMRTAEFVKLSPMTSSFYRQIAIDRIKTSRPELFARAFRAFDVSRKNTTKLQVKDIDFAIKEAIDELCIFMGINK